MLIHFLICSLIILPTLVGHLGLSGGYSYSLNFIHNSLLCLFSSWLKPDMGKKTKHKTQIKKKTLNPEFNEVWLSYFLSYAVIVPICEGGTNSLLESCKHIFKK